ncbi:hypothetical protein CI109_103519 [Kwoniella shandongensis]|uniref:Uncharacterized protein n=1 Tax=Kwoniella shandongensis TaxID=1734106 RepID=A0A5M6BW72_9TREE|nr:uncharacterized protein CI109_004579 [Kwoniella shandongensis]KAA5527044.1 hypothetical protein CI109_004579 [Kwoniella shandongensis]
MPSTSSLLVSSISILALLLVRQVQADNAFAGCAIFDSDMNQWTSAGVDQTTPTDCSTYCGSQSYTYAGYITTETDGPQNCYCSNLYPVTSLIEQGAVGSCPPNDDVDIRVTSTSFDLQGCFAAEGTEFDADDGNEAFVVGGPKECFSGCRSEFRAVFYQDETTNYKCRCAAGFTSLGQFTTCSANTYWLYAHSPEAQASGLSRRQYLRSLRQSQKQTREIYCPSRFTPCNIPGSTTDYECLDIMSDLEACGGCLSGEYRNVTSTIGEDCIETAIGAKFGATSCVNGQCVSSACKAGYNLVGGKCVQ